MFVDPKDRLIEFCEEMKPYCNKYENGKPICDLDTSGNLWVDIYGILPMTTSRRTHFGERESDINSSSLVAKLGAFDDSVSPQRTSFRVVIEEPSCPLLYSYPGYPQDTPYQFKLAETNQECVEVEDALLRIKERIIGMPQTRIGILESYAIHCVRNGILINQVMDFFLGKYNPEGCDKEWAGPTEGELAHFIKQYRYNLEHIEN